MLNWVGGNKKSCSRCGEIKSLEGFNKNKSGKYGVESVCKKCIRKKHGRKERVSKIDSFGLVYCIECKARKNKEEFKFSVYKEKYNPRCNDCLLKKKIANKNIRQEKRIIWLKNDQDIINKREERKKKYIENYASSNKKILYSKAKDYRLKNKDKRNEKNKQWMKTDKGRICYRIANHRRRQKSKAQTFYILKSKTMLYSFKHLFNNKCFNCNSEVDIEWDHFIPVSKGGGFEKDNIYPLCKKCNGPSGKGANYPDEFYDIDKLALLQYLLILQSKL
jgi:hypothetical protein